MGTAAQSGSAFFPFLVGLLAQAKGVSILPPFVVACLVLQICVWVSVVKSKQSGAGSVLTLDCLSLVASDVPRLAVSTRARNKRGLQTQTALLFVIALRSASVE